MTTYALWTIVLTLTVWLGACTGLIAAFAWVAHRRDLAWEAETNAAAERMRREDEWAALMAATDTPTHDALAVEYLRRELDDDEATRLWLGER